jgi:YVTN family beta-propeller protein
MNATKHRARWVVSFGAVVAAAHLAAAQAPPTAAARLLVVLRTNKGPGTMQIIDPAKGTLLASVPTGVDPHGVAASPDGAFAYVANDNGCSLSVIDLAAAKEVRRVELGAGSRPHDVRYADGKVYFTLEGYKAVGRYDPASAKTDWMIGTGQNGTHMMAIARDLSRIFTANNASDTVSAIERSTPTSSDWNVTLIPIPKSPEGIEMSPNGKEVWIASKDDGGGVSVIDVATKKVTPLPGLATKHVNRIAFTPDGKLVLVRDGQGDLLVLDALARKEIKRLKVSTTSLLVSPDGSHAYATVHPDNHVAVIDLKTLAVTGRIETGSTLDPDEMAWVEHR